MENGVMQSEYERIQKGQLIKSGNITPHNNIQMYCTDEQYYLIYFEQQILMQPVRIERITKEVAISYI